MHDFWMVSWKLYQASIRERAKIDVSFVVKPHCKGLLSWFSWITRNKMSWNGYLPTPYCFAFFLIQIILSILHYQIQNLFYCWWESSRNYCKLMRFFLTDKLHCTVVKPSFLTVNHRHQSTPQFSHRDSNYELRCKCCTWPFGFCHLLKLVFCHQEFLFLWHIFWHTPQSDLERHHQCKPHDSFSNLA